MIKEALQQVMAGQDLSFDVAKDTMNKIMNGEVAPIQMGGFLTALALKGETVEEITAFAEVMREKAGAVLHKKDVLEIVGTGGDGADVSSPDCGLTPGVNSPGGVGEAGAVVFYYT